MIPGPSLLGGLVGLTLLGLATGPLEPWQASWPLFASIVGGMALTDLVLVWRASGVRGRRTVRETLPLGVPCRVSLHLEGPAPARQVLRVWDHHPSSFRCADFPLTVTVFPGRTLRIDYQAIPGQRGEHWFGPLEVRVRSPLAFWWRPLRLPLASVVRVYPNFAPVIRYIRLGRDARARFLGARAWRRRGDGSEFQELRDYRSGDALRQIEWRASARARRLISRAYQDERDQRVVFMLDCGRRMRALDGAVSHFDESLNAVLLLAYLALRQGDSVSIQTFAGGDGYGDEAPPSRWMGPIKGAARVNEVLGLLYDLEPSAAMPDYPGAAAELLSRQPKHALVVVVTNLRGEDASDLLPALRTLRRRHLVLLASLRESALDAILDAEVRELDDALRVAGAHQLLAERRAILRAVRADGILALDVVPAELSAALADAYLGLKATRAL